MHSQPSKTADVEIRIGSEIYILPAHCVARVDRMPSLAPAPGLPAFVIGIASIGGQVMPVIDLGRLLGLAPSVLTDACKIVVAMHEKKSFALMVEQVLRVSANRDKSDGKRDECRIDIADLLARPAQIHPSTEDRSHAVPGAFRIPVSSSSIKAVGQLEAAALAVETDCEVHYISLDKVVTVSDTLPIAAVPDPNPTVIGAALHAGRAIPVLRLDLLLGQRPMPHVAPGALVVLTSGGRPCAIAVKRIIGFAFGIDAGRELDLTRLLDPFVARDKKVAQIPQARRENREETQFLLMEIAGQFCALRLNEVVRVQSECALVPVPTDWANASGLTNVDGSALPLLDAAAMLGLDHGNERSGGYVVVDDQNAGSFVIPVQRLIRIVTLAATTLRRVGEDTALSAIGTFDGRTVWVLSAALLAKRAGWRRDVA
jgi:chemotaxis signal transduction protein